MTRFFIISGCSGGGKSTLLTELARRGFAVVEEPGRRIVEQELQTGGNALPWTDMGAFLDRAMALSRDDLAQAAALPGPIFFDRGLIDAAIALAHLTGTPLRHPAAGDRRFARYVFLAPPWPEIYVTDDARRHDFADAVAEYDRLSIGYRALGYEIADIPKAAPADRADFILAAISPFSVS